MIRRAGVLVAAMALAGRSQALEYVPVFNASLLGGQYFFQGDRSSLSGNGNVLFAPTLRDGPGRNEKVFVRGNHKTPGVEAPRAFLEVFDAARHARREQRGLLDHLRTG